MPMPPKPRSLRVISGSRQPPLPQGVELPPLLEAPAPPDWLTNTDALAEWRRATRLLVANRLLAEGDLTLLAHYAALHGTLADGWRNGAAPTGHLMAQFHSLASAFGLSMLSRTKIPTPGLVPDENPFAAFVHSP